MRWVLALTLAGCAGSASDCDLVEVVLALAPDATSCGETPIGGDDTNAVACMGVGFNDGRAVFRVQVLQGIDSSVAEARVWTGSALWRLTRDSDPSGGSNVGAVVDGSRLCTNPTIVDGVITCGDGPPPCNERLCGPGADDDTPCG